jgi:hypothetical protein
MTRTRQPDEFTNLDEPDWKALFENVERSWFRLETLQAYTMDYERDEMEQFLRTGRFDREPSRWQHMLQRHTAAGRLLQRVHVVEEPLTGYLRYELAAYQQNAAAGEQIRLLPVTPPDWPTGLPRGVDYWLFDDREVWDMHYDEQGRFLRAVRSDDPDRLDTCRRWRDTALQTSMSLTDYLRRQAA